MGVKFSKIFGIGQSLYPLDRVATLAGKAGMVGKGGMAGKAGKEYHFQFTLCQRLEFDILLIFFLIFLHMVSEAFISF